MAIITDILKVHIKGTERDTYLMCLYERIKEQDGGSLVKGTNVAKG